MKRRLITVILSASLGLTLIGCSDSATTNTIAAPETTVAASETMANAAETTDELSVDSGKKYKVAVSLPPANNSWQAKMLEVVTEESAKYSDKFEFTIKNATDDNDQVNQLNIFKSDNYDLMVILPGNGTLLTPICEDIFDSGIATVILDRAIDSDKYTALVMGDNFGGGVNAAHYFGEFLNGKGDIAILRSIAGTPIDLDRYNGFVETINKDYPDIKVLVEGDGEFNREAGLEAMTNILPGYPVLDAVYAQDDEGALGALNAIQNSQRDDIKLITGFGGTKDTYELFEKNDPIYKASMSYSPLQGKDGIEMAVKILNNEPYEKINVIPSAVVTSENVAEYMAGAY